jgi:opacity protein-like surface antigen
MEKILGPTGRLLVGAVFICLLISQSVAAVQSPSNLPDLRKGLKESQCGPFNQDHREWEIMPPYASHLKPDIMPSKEKIALNESASSEQVSELTAMNTVRERDISYSGEQYKDSDTHSPANSLDIAITGQDETENFNANENWDDGYIDQIVDSALSNSMENEGKNGQLARISSPSQPLGNNLDIDVSDISVRAINTVQGGSAIATSNIIIKPVQIIICPSEVREKLR